MEKEQSLRSQFIKEYRCHRRILHKTMNPDYCDYKHYGAKNITCCLRWQGDNGFANFMEDMGPAPTKDHTIERADGTKGYSPDNCSWETRTVQANNRSNSRRLTHNGRTQTMAQWATELGVSRKIIWKRLSLGWSVEEALNFGGEQRKIAA